MPSRPPTTANDSASKPYLLPPESLTSQLSAIELLSAMWSGTDELHLTAAAESTVRQVGSYLQLPLESLGDAKSGQLKEEIAEEVVLGLKVRPEVGEGEGAGAAEGVWVNVGLRLRGDEGTRLWVSAKDSPSWLDRGRVEEVNAILAREGDEQEDTVGRILSSIERLSEYLLTLPPPSSSTTKTTTSDFSTTNTLEASPYVHRQWYYLPSLSTPSKRYDIVSLASTSSPALTGFLLAGKPGLILLEYPLTSLEPPSSELSSATTALAAFWSTIKRQSWSDIPASHKKISEVLTEQPQPRAFHRFEDITDNPETERGSDRGRKSDLSKLVRWLDAKGVRAKWCLERCLGVGGWDSAEN